MATECSLPHGSNPKAYFWEVIKFGNQNNTQSLTMTYAQISFQQIRDRLF